MKNSISCIIPAYNEARRIGSVLEAVSFHPLLAEIIVVDDASTDDTKEIVETFPHVKLVALEHNHGKSRAIHRGIQNATGEFLFFLDADLIGLTKDNITDLIRPVVENTADVAISLRRNAPPPWRWIGLDYISGERVLPRTVLEPHLDEIDGLTGFGLEVFMNKLIISKKLRLKIVRWPHVDSPYKYKKDGFWKGMRGEMRMMYHIFKTISPLAALGQIVTMMRLRVK